MPDVFSKSLKRRESRSYTHNLRMILCILITQYCFFSDSSTRRFFHRTLADSRRSATRAQYRSVRKTRSALCVRIETVYAFYTEIAPITSYVGVITRTDFDPPPIAFLTSRRVTRHLLRRLDRPIDAFRDVRSH